MGTSTIAIIIALVILSTLSVIGYGMYRKSKKTGTSLYDDAPMKILSALGEAIIICKPTISRILAANRISPNAPATAISEEIANLVCDELLEYIIANPDSFDAVAVELIKNGSREVYRTTLKSFITQLICSLNATLEKTDAPKSSAE